MFSNLCPRISLLPTVLFVAVLCSTVPAHATAVDTAIPGITASDACETPQALGARDHIRRVGGFPGETHCYRIELGSPGLWSLDLVPTELGTAQAILQVVDSADATSGRPTPRILRRSMDGQLWMAGEGAHFVTVRSEDPRRPLPAYRLDSQFVQVAMPTDHGDTDGELEIEVEGLATTCDPRIGMDHGDTDGELEIEVEGMAVGCGLERGVEGLCALASGFSKVDEYGDSLLCAAPLTDGRLVGRLDNGWGDDVDVARLEIRRWQTVQVRADGGQGLQGQLLDANGRQLVVDGADSGSVQDGSFQWTVTLAPGTYFIRLGGLAEGAYALSVHGQGR